MRSWQKDSALGVVRDAAELEKLPAEEREAWNRLWADVQSVLDKAAAKE